MAIDTPSEVRKRPYASQGWRPSSAVYHPAVFAINGKGIASMMIQSIQRASCSQRRHEKDDYEDRTQAHHDVIAVVEKWDVIWPELARESIEAPYFGFPAPVEQVAERAWDDDKVIYAAVIGI